MAGATYTNRGIGTTPKCEITVIDHKYKHVIGKRTFQGDSPPAAIPSHTMEGTGGLPIKEFGLFITELIEIKR